MSHTIPFYFDFISPYAYFAAVQLEPWLEKLEVDVSIRYVPILFAGTLNHWGHKGPAEIPPKREFTYKDSIRHATSLGLKLKFPPAHPFNPLFALRVATALEGHELQSKAVLDLFHAAWRDGLDLTSPEVLAQRLAGIGVGNPQGVLDKCSDPTVKQALRQQTEDAVANGVFGVPTFLIEGELFWGCDQFDFMEDCLLGGDPIQDYPSNIGSHPVGASRLG